MLDVDIRLNFISWLKWSSSFEFLKLPFWSARKVQISQIRGKRIFEFWSYFWTWFSLAKPDPTTARSDDTEKRSRTSISLTNSSSFSKVQPSMDVHFFLCVSEKERKSMELRNLERYQRRSNRITSKSTQIQSNRIELNPHQTKNKKTTQTKQHNHNQKNNINKTRQTQTDNNNTRQKNKPQTNRQTKTKRKMFLCQSQQSFRSSI